MAASSNSFCGHCMCTFPDVKTSLFLPRPSSPPSCSPRATAKSSDITRMFQRLEGEREGGRGGHRRSHAHMHKSAGRSVCVVSRPHVVKRSRFLCLFLHKRRRTEEAAPQAGSRERASSPSSQPSSISPNATVDQIGRGHVSAQIKSVTSFKEASGRRRDILQSHITLSPRYFLTR